MTTSRDWLGWTHLLAGAAGIVAFLATGEFMDTRLDHLRGMADGPRALYRSGHIYILFSALLNLVLGANAARLRPLGLRLVQLATSALVLGSLLLFVVSFYAETPLAVIERPLVRLGIYLTAGSVVLHTLAVLTAYGDPSNDPGRGRPPLTSADARKLLAREHVHHARAAGDGPEEA